MTSPELPPGQEEPSETSKTVVSPQPAKLRRSLPSLKVKQDTSLKSCLSPAPDPRTATAPGKPEQKPSNLRNPEDVHAHPSFLVSEDDVSPNLHGLIQEEQVRLVSPETVESDPKQPPVTQEPELKQARSPAPSFSLPGASVDSLNSLTSESLSRLHPRVKPRDPQEVAEWYKYILTKDDLVWQPYHDKEKRESKLHLLIGITGCISVHENILLIIEKLFELYTPERLEIQVVLTKSAEWFLSEKLYKFEKLGVKVWHHDDGFTHYLNSKLDTQIFSSPKSSICQIYLAPELQKWTDVLLLAPLSANTLAKVINGLSDNLLTDILHTWPTPQNHAPVPGNKTDNTVITNNINSPKPIIAALALTNSMYSHPITKYQLKLLQETYPNVSILKPVEKCVDVDGNISMGGMRSWREVVDFVSKKLGEPEDEDNADDNDDDDDDDYEDEVTDSTIPEIHLNVEETVSPPILEHEEGYTPTPQNRSRSNTFSKKELLEHERLASQNAIKNTGILRSNGISEPSNFAQPVGPVSNN